MIAVIGATGFTGHRVVHALREAYPQEAIVAIVRATSSRVRLAGTNVEYRIADLDDRPALTAALNGSDRVVCTASLGFGHAPNICAAIGAEERQHAVLFSSTSIFTRVPNKTRTVRVRAEEIIRDSGIPATILRPTMIYGHPGDRNVERLLRFLRRSPLVPVVDRGSALQQPVFVDDLAEAVAQVLEQRAATIGNDYNLPGAKAITFAQLVRSAGWAVGRRPMLVSLPARVGSMTAAGWKRTGLPPHISQEQILRITEDKSVAWDQARVDFGYAPRAFSRGVVQEASELALLAHTASGVGRRDAADASRPRG